MRALRNLLDQLEPQFQKGGRFEKFYTAFEAIDTFLYSPGDISRGSVHIRDHIDLKRTMWTVVLALMPCYFMAVWNTGYQANLALASAGATGIEGWRGSLMALLGAGYDPGSFVDNLLHGLVWFAPVWIVTHMAGGFWEGLFATVRGHEINEGFLVTGSLIPLILPPTIPLWQVAIGTSFGVVIGKEIFGGTGRNFMNPALTARAFLYFAYPAQISGNAVWVAVDGYTRATPLGIAAEGGMEAVKASGYSFFDAAMGLIPGSMGETSAVACLIGAVFLLFTGIASWRVMLSTLVASMGLATLFWVVGSETNPMFSMGPLWHLVTGGLAFGIVFMTTDPVSSAMTRRGQFYYGALIGVMVILVRVINPAFPEGIMLAILFGNVMAPAIDKFVLMAHNKRRRLRYVQ